DDDTGGGSFHESLPRPHPATLTISPTVGVAEEPLTLTSLLALFPTCLQRIATLEAELKATKILHRDTEVLFAKRIKKLESKLKTKKRKLVLSDLENEEEARKSQELDALLDLANAALHELSHSTTPFKPANPEQSSEQEINFTDADIPAGELDSAGGLDSASRLDSAGGVDSAGGLPSAEDTFSVRKETTSVSAGVPIAAGDPIPAVTFVFAGFSIFAVSSIPATTPIATGVSTTAGASGSASEAYVPIIELLNSPPQDTSLPLDLKTEESDDDEPAEPVSLALVSDITSWEIIPTEFGYGELHVITRAYGTVKRFSTLRELMYWAGRANLMVLYGLVSDKYKTERAKGIGLGLWMDLRILITSREERDASIIWDDQDQWQIQSWRFYPLPAIHVLETKAGDIMYMFVDKKYPLTPATLQRMLNHGLEIDKDPSGNDLTTAI
nr:hypothetical protein [Tanacetum cinerariifolium]